MTEPELHPIVQARIQAARAEGVRMATFRILLRPSDREALGLPEGARFCRWCGTSPLPGMRRSWCSDGCVAAYSIRSDMATVRRRLKERDAGVCCACGFDTEEGRKQCFAEEPSPPHLPGRVVDGRWVQDLTPEYADWIEKWKPYANRYGIRLQSWWEADHIVPCSEGGGICGLENYRTLCIACHRRETAELARRLGPKRAEANAKRRSAEEAWRDRQAGQLRMETPDAECTSDA